MNVFFDVDDTIIASNDLTLRPGVREVFERLQRDGHAIYVWSGSGLRWRELDRHDLRRYVVDCFRKPVQNHRQYLSWLGVTVEPDFVVDDYPDVVDVFGGHLVRPYAVADPDDREMESVYRKIAEAARGASA